jgi:hypothetical protein
MAQLPSPLSSDPQDFSAIAAIAAELLQAGRVRLGVSPPANITYNIKSIDLETAVVKPGIEPSVARSILKEISIIASLVLRGEQEKFIDQLVERPVPDSAPRLSEDEKSEVKSILLNKFHLVQTQLVTERVSQKFYAAKASKHDTFISLQWEITERKYDQNEGEKARGPKALMKFEVTSRPKIPSQPEFETLASSFLSMFGIDASYRRNFLIECDEDDIDDLIDTLNDAKLRLAQERGK